MFVYIFPFSKYISKYELYVFIFSKLKFKNISIYYLTATVKSVLSKTQTKITLIYIILSKKIPQYFLA